MSKTAKRRAKAKARGSANAGRPSKPGARYPNGRLKPICPNALMVERRKALCDDVTKATCPLDVALANEWITPAEHRAGVTFAALYRQAGLGAPVLAGATVNEAQTGSRPDRSGWNGFDKNEWASVISEKGSISALWDATFRDQPSADELGAKERRAADAMKKWKAVNEAMSAEVRAEMHRVCILEQWPDWMIVMGRMKAKAEASATRAPVLHTTGRNRLRDGAQAVRLALRKPKAQPAPATAVQALADPVAPVRKVAETTLYVTAAGEPVLEVVRMVRVR